MAHKTPAPTEPVAKVTKPEPAPTEPVAFVSDAEGVTVWDSKNDRPAAQFVAGEFATDDEATIALLDATEGVHRA